MRMDADSDEEGCGDDYDASGDEAWDPGNDRAYWRRRFFILCGGVVALGACAWLFPGAHQPSAHDVVRYPRVHGRARQAAGAAPGRLRQPVAGAEQARRVAHAGAASCASSAYHPGPVPSASASASRAACAPADIVLSLFTSQSSYAKGARPKFSVYAVSTSATACTLAYGR